MGRPSRANWRKSSAGSWLIAPSCSGSWHGLPHSRQGSAAGEQDELRSICGRARRRAVRSSASCSCPSRRRPPRSAAARRSWCCCRCGSRPAWWGWSCEGAEGARCSRARRYQGRRTRPARALPALPLAGQERPRCQGRGQVRGALLTDPTPDPCEPRPSAGQVGQVLVLEERSPTTTAAG